MLRLTFRFVGLICLACAFAALVVDGSRSVAAAAIVVLPLGRVLADLSPDILSKLRAIILPHLPLLWDPVLVSLLLLPSWVVFGLVGLILFTLTRHRAPKIGYSRR